MNSPTHLLKFSQKMQWARLDVADLQEHGPSSRSILITAMRAIFVRSKLLLRIGKRCKKLVVSIKCGLKGRIPNDGRRRRCHAAFRPRPSHPTAPRRYCQYGRHDDRMVRFSALRPDGRD